MWLEIWQTDYYRTFLWGVSYRKDLSATLAYTDLSLVSHSGVKWLLRQALVPSLFPNESSRLRACLKQLSTAFRTKQQAQLRSLPGRCNLKQA